ncbi:ATP-dependent DNA helicase RecG [Polaromonas sp. CG_9.5]|uniref:ATP-binding protein n=1 Tax=Polaromonas sp. CG_9.5 TaxID=3071705 RepID=UPI002E04D48F|nr:ATP-dependent DNA helicase RecG [Polaromonas sp. CG_9.5]
MNGMTAKELQAWLRTQFPKENERHEWKEWRSLKQNISGRKGEDLVSYVAALANMDGGCVVIGAQDRTLEVTGIQDFADYTAENVVHRILGKTPGLPSMRLRIEELEASDTGAIVWLVQVPRHAPRQPVLAHDKAWQRDGDSLTELREDRLKAILTEVIAGQDWSARVSSRASLTDLDPVAIAKAREKFSAKHQQERWAPDIARWSTAEFLNRAKITLHGEMTYTALLLLGLPESVALLTPSVAEITWKVPSERIAKHFGPPFVLTTTEVGQHIRNPNIKLFPDTELLAIELPRYDNQVVLEGLHNCLAHQDYEQAARIVVLETPGRLQLTSRGGFVDGNPEDYFTGNRTPSVYRNPWLAQAMNNIGMIDKGGYGIRDMVASQRKRYLPLPDYEGSTPIETIFNIYGQAIDENYSKLLIERSDLPLEQVIWLDRVQKKHRIGNDQAAILRSAKLIEGRKPNFFVTAHVADATNTRPEYTRNKGLNDHYYKTLILQHIKQFKSVSVLEVRSLLLDKLPDSLTPIQKQAKVKNLLTALRMSGLEGQKIVATHQGKGGRWTLLKP